MSIRSIRRVAVLALVAGSLGFAAVQVAPEGSGIDPHGGKHHP